jgi:hypothetical protein
MNIICVNCGEPWDMDHVLHEEPELFERKGGIIKHCPCCPKDGSEPKLDFEQKAKLDIIETLGEMLGDDIDGFASELNDYGLV